MHNAPAVSFPVGRSHFQGTLIGLLVVSGFLAVSVWSLQVDALGWRQWLAASLCLATSVWAGWSWWRAPIGSLSWDGAVWNWAVGGRLVMVRPEAMLDIQSAILLRLQVTADSGGIWVWLDRASSAPRWMALRRAIYSRVKPADNPLADHADSPKASVRRTL